MTLTGAYPDRVLRIKKNHMGNLKSRLLSGETLNGSFLNLGSHVTAEILGNAGFDWLLIDLEHGAGNDSNMFQQLQAAGNTKATTCVRTHEFSRPQVQRILDSGASGVMFPQIRTREEAEIAVKMMYYPPKGNRGLARMVRAHKFGKITKEYMDGLEENLISIIQIETIDALKNIDAIAAVQGVDVLFVGPSDLTMALGIFAKFDHADYQNAIRTVASSAKNHGKATGVLMQDISEYEMYHKLGYRFLASGADSIFVTRGADAMAKEMQKRSGEMKP